MESAVDVAEARRVDMRVYLRRADVRMAEKLLDRPYVGAVGEHVRGERMAQNVRRYALRRDSDGGGPFADDLEDALAREKQKGV